jgi:hypothetical protein
MSNDFEKLVSNITRNFDAKPVINNQEVLHKLRTLKGGFVSAAKVKEEIHNHFGIMLSDKDAETYSTILNDFLGK